MLWNKKNTADGQPPEKPAGNPLVGQDGVNYLILLISGYLVYLGAKLLWEWYRGEEVNPLVAIASGAGFILVGLWGIWKQWRAYQEHREADAAETEEAAEPEMPGEPAEREEEQEE